MKYVAVFFSCILLSTGCSTTLRQSPLPTLSADCASATGELDALITENSHFDPAVHRIKNHPLLRSNRFLASFHGNLSEHDAYSAWLKALNTLSIDTYASEFSRIPEDKQTRWLAQHDAVDVRAALNKCSEPLISHIDHTHPFRKEDIQPKDNYSLALRSVGLYPITSHLSQLYIDRYRSKMTTRVSHGGLQAFEKILYYQPNQPSYLSPEAIHNDMANTYASNPLGIPSPDTRTLAALFSKNAPVLHIEHKTPADFIGHPVLRNNNTIFIDDSSPTVFTHTSHTRLNGDILLQLNYIFWFSERPKRSILDIYGGDLDAVIWRVTLDRKGTPILYDTIHGCGCYHLVFLPEGTKANIARIRGDKPLVFPLQDFSTLHPVELKIEGGTHYLLKVKNPDSLQGKPYTLLPYEELLQLPSPEGRKSLFGKHGIISQSHRLERFLLWPLGIPSAGAMRERGMHATAFIGRRHFDDPYLLEELEVSFTPSTSLLAPSALPGLIRNSTPGP